MASNHLLKRSISMANMEKRERIKRELNKLINLRSDDTFHYVEQPMAGHLNYMINFYLLSEEFSRIVMNDMVDLGMLDHLEETKALNCFRCVRRLHPLKTLGDGNCLLHAVSLAMWSFSDHNALLRRLVYVALCSDKGDFKRRWKRRQERIDREEGSIAHSQQEWRQMWETVKESASDIKQRQPNQLPYRSLEHIHVFALSNILRRPIVIVSDTVVHYPSGSLHESLDTFDGIYLPLLWEAKDCVHSPLVLGYANSHFAPLLGMDATLNKEPDNFSDVIPLVKYNLQQRTIHFLLENEERRWFNLLNEYLILTEVEQNESGSVSKILCAKILYNPLEDDLNLMWDHFEELTKNFRKNEYPASPEAEKPLHLKQSSDRNEVISMNLDLSEKPKAPEKKIFDSPPPQAEDPYPDDWSIMPVECAFPNCKYRASKNTAPYCHDHYKPGNRDSRDTRTPDKGMVDLKLSETNESGEDERLNERIDDEQSPGMHQCCSPEKCCKKGCFEGRCQEHYVFEPLVTESPRCKRGSCPFHGSPRSDEYCLECVQYYGLDEEDLKILEQLPPREAIDKSNARVFYKCKQEGCYAASTEVTLGLCNRHFLDRYKAGLQKIPTREEAHRYLKDMKEKKARRMSEIFEPPKTKERKRTPSGQVREKKHLCATPGCAGVRCRHNDLCLECYRSVQYKREPDPVALVNYHVPRDEEEMELGRDESQRGDPDIVESQEPSPTGSPVTCRGPGCFNVGRRVYNGLCEDCFRLLERRNVAKVSTPKSQLKEKTGAQRTLFQDQPRQCKTSGCGFAGTPQQNGYCSTCYSKQQRGVILSEESQRVLRQNFQLLLDNMQPQEVIDILFSKNVIAFQQMEELHAIPTDREKIRYLLLHLLNRGAEEDFDTFVHVLCETRQQHLATVLRDARYPQAHSGQESRHRVMHRESREPSESAPTSRLAISGSSFEESLAQLERTAKANRQKCKFRGCQNFGNPNRGGFCNEGHIDCDNSYR